MRRAGGIDHVLARHVEGASHMADGYTRTRPGNIGVCLGTSGPAGTDMITGLYAAAGKSPSGLNATAARWWLQSDSLM
jgi:tartronate-semialdehyde synthase